MRTFLVLSLVLACSKQADDKTAASTAPAPAAKRAIAAGGDALPAHASAFFMKLADAMDSGDCAKLAAGLEAMAPDAKALHEEMKAAGKKLKDIPPDPQFVARMQAVKDPGIID